MHEKATYQEILNVITSIDIEKHPSVIREKKDGQGEKIYNTIGIEAEFNRRLSDLGWKTKIYSYYLAHSFNQRRAMSRMSFEEQKRYLAGQGADAICAHHQINHFKRHVALEIRLDGQSSFVAYDLFVKHLAFYSGRVINVGVEILPTKAMQREMSSGIAYYEGELHNILRHGRSNPPVPLVIIGLEP